MRLRRRCCAVLSRRWQPPAIAALECQLPVCPHPLLQAKGTISVLNNGAGIPVEVHKVEKIYVPELIFGNLLTSSNYNDKEKKVRRSGMGGRWIGLGLGWAAGLLGLGRLQVPQVGAAEEGPALPMLSVPLLGPLQ